MEIPINNSLNSTNSSSSNSSSSNNCTICFTEISEQDKIIFKCDHFFCNSCIQDWLNKGKNSCPLCRKEINEYKLNGENYRLIIKQINNPNENLREINIMNRELIRINGRIKCFLYLSVICSTYFADMYLNTLNNYHLLNDKYLDCNTNLTEYENIYNNKIVDNVGIFSLDTHMFKSCSISQYFYDKCFINYNYNE